MKNRILPITESERITDLIGDIRGDLRLLVREEIQLAKTELSEKVDNLKRNSIFVIAGAIGAYTAAIFLLLALAAMVALGIHAAGLSVLLSIALGAFAVFLLVGTAGYIFLQKGIAGFREPLVPEKTLATLGKQTKAAPDLEPKDDRSSQDLQREVEVTQGVLGEHMENLKSRLAPKRLIRVLVIDQVKQHPFRLMSIATAAGVGIALVNRIRIAMVHRS
jgi:hypothetical protein